MNTGLKKIEDFIVEVRAEDLKRWSNAATGDFGPEPRKKPFKKKNPEIPSRSSYEGMIKMHGKAFLDPGPRQFFIMEKLLGPCGDQK